MSFVSISDIVKTYKVLVDSRSELISSSYERAETKGRELIGLAFGVKARDHYLKNFSIEIDHAGRVYIVSPQGVYCKVLDESYCIQPEDYFDYCDADNVLTLALWLKANPAEFFRRANVTAHMWHPGPTD